jgi:hypothetical protein
MKLEHLIQVCGGEPRLVHIELKKRWRGLSDTDFTMIGTSHDRLVNAVKEWYQIPEHQATVQTEDFVRSLHQRWDENGGRFEVASGNEAIASLPGDSDLAGLPGYDDTGYPRKP